MEDAALLDASERLAKRLLNLGQLHGERTEDGIALRISQEELASFLGLSRQVVNQYLQGWLAKGWVRLGRGVVTVCNEAALKKLAHVDELQTQASQPFVSAGISREIERPAPISLDSEGPAKHRPTHFTRDRRRSSRAYTRPKLRGAMVRDSEKSPRFWRQMSSPTAA